MSKNGNRYSRVFKEEAVRLLLTSGKTAQQLGKELGVTGHQKSQNHWQIRKPVGAGATKKHAHFMHESSLLRAAKINLQNFFHRGGKDCIMELISAPISP